MPKAPENIARTPPVPRRNDGEPVFAEPWQAQAFALTVSLHENGHIAWAEWAETLGTVLEEAGENDPPENYYRHWLTALERLTGRIGLVSPKERESRKSAWERATRATPHGTPIVLANDPQSGR